MQEQNLKTKCHAHAYLEKHPLKRVSVFPLPCDSWSALHRGVDTASGGTGVVFLGNCSLPSPFSHWSQHWHVFEAPWFSSQYGPPSAYLDVLSTYIMYIHAKVQRYEFSDIFWRSVTGGLLFFLSGWRPSSRREPCTTCCSWSETFGMGPHLAGGNKGVLWTFWGRFFFAPDCFLGGPILRGNQTIQNMHCLGCWFIMTPEKYHENYLKLWIYIQLLLRWQRVKDEPLRLRELGGDVRNVLRWPLLVVWWLYEF